MVKPPGFNPWVRKIHWRREWQCTPIFFPGEFHGQKEPGRLQSVGLQSRTYWGTHIRTFPDSPNTLHLGSWFLFFCMLFAICTYWWFLKLCPVTAAASLRVFLSLLHCQLLHLGPGPHLSHLDHWICLLIGLPHSRLASPPHPTSYSFPKYSQDGQPKWLFLSLS